MMNPNDRTGPGRTQILDGLGWEAGLAETLARRDVDAASAALARVLSTGRADAGADAAVRACDGAFRASTQPVCRTARWPGGAPFALFLSHDVDQIYDRELFRWLGDINHLRRHWFHGERGRAGACFRRILRPVFHPIDPMIQFTRIREIEGAHGWRSTFFLLEDEYWNRRGGRFRWSDPEVGRIARYLEGEECELGIHGSAIRHADPGWWSGAANRFNAVFGRRPAGARNHYLSLSVPGTWAAQRAGGLAYDSTLGEPARPGAPGGYAFPFVASGAAEAAVGRLVELPLTVMDQTLFRYLGLGLDGAMARSREEIGRAVDAGGLVTLLWHNNFFREEEFAEWEEVYRLLLAWLAPQAPWAACGREIADWWTRRGAVRVSRTASAPGAWRWEMHAGMAVEGLAIEIAGIADGTRISLDGGAPLPVRRVAATAGVAILPRLQAGERIGIVATVGKGPGP